MMNVAGIEVGDIVQTNYDNAQKRFVKVWYVYKFGLIGICSLDCECDNDKYKPVTFDNLQKPGKFKDNHKQASFHDPQWLNVITKGKGMLFSGFINVPVIRMGECIDRRYRVAQ